MSAVGEILSRHHPRWDAPARCWEEGVPLGNGRVGAVLWGDGAPLVCNVDHAAFWDRTAWKPDPERHGFAAFRRAIEGDESAWGEGWPIHQPEFNRLDRATRLPPSRFEASFDSPVKFGQVTLDLGRAVACGSIEVGGVATTFELVVLADTDLVRWTFVGAVPRFGFLSFRDVGFRGAPPALAQALGDAAEHVLPTPQRLFAEKGYAAPDRGRDHDVEWFVQPVPDGGEAAIAWRVDSHELWAAFEHRRDGTNACAAAIERVRAAPTLEGHRRWWTNHWDASWVSIPDTGLESLYVLETYKLGATMAASDGPPASLIGPWAPDGQLPVWGGDYHFNVNVQMTYSPIYTGNRLGLGAGLYGWVEQVRPAFREYCREFIGRDGEFVPTSTDDAGTSRYDWPMVAFSFCNGPWLAHLLWLHWRYSRDEVFLHERVVPFLAAVIEPLLAELTEGNDGRLHLPFSYAPEYTVGDAPPYGPDSTTDLALLRFALEALIEAGETRYETTLDRLAPLPSRPGGGPLGGLAGPRGGLMVRSDLPFDHSHRHHCHLMPIHPLLQLRVDGPDAELVEESIRTWMFWGQGEWVGFSYPWAASICARAAEPELARTFLQQYADHWVTPNTFMLQYPPRRSLPTVWNAFAGYMTGALTLEAGFGFCAAVQDMLLQSDGGLVRVFPTAVWERATFEDLRADGAFLVSAALDGDHVAYIRVASIAGGDVTLRLPGEDDHRLELAAGEVFERGDPGALRPVASQPWWHHRFGVKKP